MAAAQQSDVLPDILAPGLRIVFCGSAAGRRSAEVGAYYAGRGNLFWPTLALVGLTPHRFELHEFRDLPRYGLGLTDVCKTQFGADAELERSADDPDGLRRKIERYQPAAVAFVGKRPAQVFLGRRTVSYGLQPETVGRTALFVLPSPSGLARGSWDEKWWWELARRCGPTSPRPSAGSCGVDLGEQALEP